MRFKSPESALTEYLGAAVEGDARRMRRAMQVSFPAKRQRTEPLRQVLTGFEVMGRQPVSEVMVDVTARLTFSGRGDGVFRFRCICEDETGAPTEAGSWGVNPSSMRAVEPAT